MSSGAEINLQSSLTGGGGEGADGNEGPFPAWREVEYDEKDDGENGDDYVDRHEELHHAKPHGSDLPGRTKERENRAQWVETVYKNDAFNS